MIKRDWSLVFFTSLAQWSVGIILWLGFLVIYNQDVAPVYETGLNPANPVLLALVFIGVATFSSCLHLGNPANAPRTLSNLSSSWLSREILAIGLFTASLVLLLVLGWKTGDAVLLKYLVIPALVFGPGLLWTMSRIYMMPTIPAWNSWHTPVSFVTTALALGVITLLFLGAIKLINLTDHFTRFFQLALIATLLVEIFSAIGQHIKLPKINQGMDVVVFDKGPFYRVFQVRMALLIFILLLVMLLVLKPGLLPPASDAHWIARVLLLVLIQELAGRFMFYASYFRLGV